MDASTNQRSVRFSLLTALVWLLVAAGIIYLLWNVILRMSSQRLPISTPTSNLTQVYETIAVMLTGQGTSPLPISTQTITPSPMARPTLVPSTTQPVLLKTSTPGGATQTETVVIRCDRAAAGNPIDVTIPDDSELTPGQNFTKTWKLLNSGTCTWSTSYSASFFYGDRMGAPGMVPFKNPVLPGHEVEISIEMVAPLSPGAYQGNWKLSNADDVLFGIGPNADSPFWVRIVVAEEEIPSPSPTQTLTPAISPTGAITPTATPQGEIGGTLLLIPGDTVDLDTLTPAGEGQDLSYQAGNDGYHWLIPQDSAVIGVYGNQPPALPNCQSAGKGSAPVAVESLSIGTYLCYTTNEGHPGRALLMAVDASNFTITLDLLTWALP